MDLVSQVVARYKQAVDLESERLAKEMARIEKEIEKLRAQATKAEEAGQLGRADGLRSKMRDLRQKLDRAEEDRSSALWKEEPLNKEATEGTVDKEAFARGIKSFADNAQKASIQAQSADFKRACHFINGALFDLKFAMDSVGLNGNTLSPVNKQLMQVVLKK